MTTRKHGGSVNRGVIFTRYELSILFRIKKKEIQSRSRNSRTRFSRHQEYHESFVLNEILQFNYLDPFRHKLRDSNREGMERKSEQNPSAGVSNRAVGVA